MIVVSVPDTFAPEREYIVSVLLGEFLGLPYALETHARPEVVLRNPNDGEEQTLTLADSFFQRAGGRWLEPASLPARPLERWRAQLDLPEATLVAPELPIIYGEGLPSGRWFERDERGIRLGLDVFGSAFFMLTRYEEIVKPDRDQHDRFPARASLAYQEGFLERPIVNEYLEVLWAAMKRLWPNLSRKGRDYELLLSHDVDWPYMPRSVSLSLLFKQVTGDFVKRHDIKLAIGRIAGHFPHSVGQVVQDPYDTFDWLMKLSEEENLKSAFYFIPGRSAGDIDGVYSLNDPNIEKLLREIHERGHNIGFHPSYNTLRDAQRIFDEFHTLLKAVDRLGIVQDLWGGRQHYLRWEAPTTWEAWAAAELDYDSSVGFADHVGFRSGVCYEYPTFSINTRKTLPLLERPLIVMEQTLLDRKYMGLDHNSALLKAKTLQEHSRTFSGQFTLLWHNSQLVHHRDRWLYRSLVSNAQ